MFGRTVNSNPSTGGQSVRNQREQQYRSRSLPRSPHVENRLLKKRPNSRDRDKYQKRQKPKNEMKMDFLLTSKDNNARLKSDPRNQKSDQADPRLGISPIETSARLKALWEQHKLHQCRKRGQEEQANTRREDKNQRLNQKRLKPEQKTFKVNARADRVSTIPNPTLPQISAAGLPSIKNSGCCLSPEQKEGQQEQPHCKQQQIKSQKPATDDTIEEQEGNGDGVDDYNVNRLKVVEGDILANRYEIKEQIGTGTFGQVLRCYDNQSQTEVAVKVIKSLKQFTMSAQTEIKLLELLSAHDPQGQSQTVRMLNHFVHRNHQCIVFELLHCNLYDLLQKTRFKGISLDFIRKFARQLLRTLSFLSQLPEPIIHCDLKLDNIMLCHPRKSAIKVVDFGISCKNTKKVCSYVQTRSYRSPEVLLGLPYDVAIDMWSLGCVLFAMHTGKTLFPSENNGMLGKMVDVLGSLPKEMATKALFMQRKKLPEQQPAVKCYLHQEEEEEGGRIPGIDDAYPEWRTRLAFIKSQGEREKMHALEKFEHALEKMQKQMTVTEIGNQRALAFFIQFTRRCIADAKASDAADAMQIKCYLHQLQDRLGQPVSHVTSELAAQQSKIKSGSVITTSNINNSNSATVQLLNKGSARRANGTGKSSAGSTKHNVGGGGSGGSDMNDCQSNTAVLPLTSTNLARFSEPLRRDDAETQVTNSTTTVAYSPTPSLPLSLNLHADRLYAAATAEERAAAVAMKAAASASAASAAAPSTLSAVVAAIIEGKPNSRLLLRILIDKDFGQAAEKKGNEETEKDLLEEYVSFCDLLEKMLCYDPQKRITPMEALQHPFLRENAMVAPVVSTPRYQKLEATIASAASPSANARAKAKATVMNTQKALVLPAKEDLGRPEEGNEAKETENTPEKSLPKKKKAKMIVTVRQQRERQPMKPRSNSPSLSASEAVRSGTYHA